MFGMVAVRYYLGVWDLVGASKYATLWHKEADCLSFERNSKYPDGGWSRARPPPCLRELLLLNHTTHPRQRIMLAISLLGSGLVGLLRTLRQLPGCPGLAIKSEVLLAAILRAHG